MDFMAQHNCENFYWAFRDGFGEDFSRDYLFGTLGQTRWRDMYEHSQGNSSHFSD